MKCRHCQSELQRPLIDLGTAPPSNAFLTAVQLHAPERWYPLRVLVCSQCWLAQTEDYADADELFPHDYAYFSSYSSTWLAHAEAYTQTMIKRFGLNNNSLVVEVAANDGYLLQYFQQRGIPCFGVEPTASTASAARAKGIDIIESFFDSRLAEHLCGANKQADLVIANNVLAHVPDINDFVASFSVLLKPTGVATFEFPHLLKLVQESQFDTIYHEHYSYLSLTCVHRIFCASGLQVFDVDELKTHGGSLRVYAQRSDAVPHSISRRVLDLLEQERAAGMLAVTFYEELQDRANRIKNDLLAFLLEVKRSGQRVAAYGAAAKGNTILNYAGIKADLLPYVVDRNPVKQGKYLPGSRIPIVTEDVLRTERPDWVLILPWNLNIEIREQLAYTAEWGGRFAVAIPKMECSD